MSNFQEGKQDMSNIPDPLSVSKDVEVKQHHIVKQCGIGYSNSFDFF